MLAAAVPFVQAAARLTGVSRIALIGSLTTEKVDPKDIDLLVTIAEHTDVQELDRLARHLLGLMRE
jgi:predicted nucleotidyltransferase